MKSDLLAIAAQMPKAELHLHIEGSLEPEMVFQLAKRNQLPLAYASVQQLRQAYDFANLQQFLDVYYAGMAVLRTEQDFYDLTWAYLLRAQQDNIVHVEIFFDPQAHLSRGIDLAVQINGISAALQQGQEQLQIGSRLILSFLRHLSQQDALHTLELAKPYLDRIDGFGLDSSERDHPPSKFVELFAQCRALGLPITMHAGEEGPADYVWQALEQIKVCRIDHGNRALDDVKLVQELVQRQIALTMCPLSNLKLRVIDEMAQFPLQQALAAGLKVTINSDDPAYFGGYLNANFAALVQHNDLTKAQLYQLAHNSFSAAWLTTAQRQQYIDQLDAYFASC